mgnify:CR=1 FL=1
MIKFLDFDGVIVDSIYECYIVSKDVYFGYTKFPYDEDEYKALFYKYRGLVRPAYEYMILHKSIEACLEGEGDNIGNSFRDFSTITSSKDKSFYEKEFFYKRSLYQSDDMEFWISINPITPFGETLIGSNDDVIIVTTKNKEATVALLEHYQIKVADIYANEEIKFHGNKGALISYVMNKSNIEEAMFLDDAVGHLDTVKDDRVTCFFADWGYGHDDGNYPIYEY